MNHPATILIVDDEAAGRETLDALLRAEGYRLIQADGADEALDLARAHLPDVMLLDVMLPETDGFAVCRALRADHALAEIPIILVTALSDRSSRMEGLAAGADDFISKPFDRAELRARIRTITRLNRYRRLINQRAQFEWVVEQADEGYLLLDQLGAIHYANDTARRYLYITPGEALPDRSFVALAAQHYQIEPPIDPAAPLAQLPSHPLLLIRSASDQADACIVQVNFLETTGDPQLHRLARLRDITAQTTEQQMVWSFQAMVRHKLGTAMLQFHGALQAIEQLRLDPGADDTNKLLAIALKGAARLQASIKDIFRYMDSRDILAPEQGSCSLSALPEMAAGFSAAMGIAPVDVRYAGVADPQKVTLAIAQPALELIIGELFANACKFHPRGTPTLELIASTLGPAIQIDVCDDGQVLAPEQLAYVWRPYYQAERHFTGQMPGMGLGLTVVATLLWRIGGACRIYNRAPPPGVGVSLIIPSAS